MARIKEPHGALSTHTPTRHEPGYGSSAPTTGKQSSICPGVASLVIKELAPLGAARELIILDLLVGIQEIGEAITGPPRGRQRRRRSARAGALT
jgi:hypothetical protein